MTNFLRQINDYVTHLMPDALRADTVPDRLIVRPVDVWRGDKQRGALLCNGVFTCYGRSVELHGECWEPEAVTDADLQYLHGFEWLRDLRAEATAAARQQARALIESWAMAYTRPRVSRAGGFSPWEINLIGKRIALWIAHYDFFAIDADGDFQDLFFVSLYRQARFLIKEIMLQASAKKPRQGYMSFNDHVPAVKGMLFCGLAFEGHEEWVHIALDQLGLMTDRSLSVEGMHHSRSPYMTLRFLRNMIDVRSALQAGGFPVPEWLDDIIAKQVPVVRFFRFADKYFSLQHGAMCSDAHYIDDVLAQAAVKGKRIKNLTASGYAKLSVGRSTILFDHGPAAQHCAPLSFEMSYGKDRMFVHCGSHQTDAMWQQMLAQPAAHNTLNIVESDGISAAYQCRDVRYDTKADYAYVQASHDGYMSETGLQHFRSLYLGSDGHDLRGEDVLSTEVPLMQAYQAAIRFHIHPDVMVSVVQGGEQVLLRLPSGIGWRFRQSGGVLALEDSIYAGHTGAMPEKTHQIVIYKAIDSEHCSVKWALQREGL